MLVEAKSDVNAKDKEYDPDPTRALTNARRRFFFYFARFNSLALAVDRPRSINLLREATSTLVDCLCI